MRVSAWRQNFHFGINSLVQVDQLVVEAEVRTELWAFFFASFTIALSLSLSWSGCVDGGESVIPEELFHLKFSFFIHSFTASSIHQASEVGKHLGLPAQYCPFALLPLPSAVNPSIPSSPDLSLFPILFFPSASVCIRFNFSTLSHLSSLLLFLHLFCH